MKINLLDKKNYNLVFKDSVTEDDYEDLLKRSYKGETLSKFYEDFYNCSSDEILDDCQRELGYPLDDTWFIHPDVLKDEDKMKALYNKVRDFILNILNSEEGFEDYNLTWLDVQNIKNMFDIKYSFKAEDRKYIKDDFEEESEEAEEDSGDYESNFEESDEDDVDQTASTKNQKVKEYLEEWLKEAKKTDPRYYLTMIALGQSKGWGYIKDPEELKGDIGFDVVTPKNAKKIMKESY